MTVAMTDGVLQVSGVCTVEEAETIANFLQEGASSVDVTGCTHLHTAGFQLLLRARLPIEGIPANPALARWVLPLLSAQSSAEAGAAIAQSLTRSME